MGLNAKAALRDGCIAITFDQRIKELLFTYEQAFKWGDELGQLASRALAQGGSGLASPMSVHASVRLRGVLVVLSLLTPHASVTLTPTDAYILSDELILVAQKAEKFQRQLLPTQHDVDAMGEVLTGVGRHSFHQHPLGTVWRASSNGHANGLSLVKRLPLLSRLIRKPWY